MTFTKIISGGQTGADQAGLQAGTLLSLATGGWMPRGWRTEAGPRPEFAALYGMLEHHAPEYPAGTYRNVLDADATLIFGNIHTPGCRLTMNICGRLHKPWNHVPWPQGALVDRALARSWLRCLSLATLNVAGNRESTNPGIYAFTRDWLMEALHA